MYNKWKKKWHLREDEGQEPTGVSPHKPHCVHFQTSCFPIVPEGFDLPRRKPGMESMLVSLLGIRLCLSVKHMDKLWTCLKSFVGWMEFTGGTDLNTMDVFPDQTWLMVLQQWLWSYIRQIDRAEGDLITWWPECSISDQICSCPVSAQTNSLGLFHIFLHHCDIFEMLVEVCQFSIDISDFPPLTFLSKFLLLFIFVTFFSEVTKIRPKSLITAIRSREDCASMFS